MLRKNAEKRKLDYQSFSKCLIRIADYQADKEAKEEESV